MTDYLLYLLAAGSIAFCVAQLKLWLHDPLTPAELEALERIEAEIERTSCASKN